MVDVPLTQGADELPRTVRGQFDWSVTNPTVAVVEAVAVATDREPLDVYSLHETIDTDALDRLLQSTRSATPSSIRVTFSYGGCDVTVRGDGLLRATLHE